MSETVLWWLFCIASLVLLCISVEIGYHIGKTRRARVESEHKTQVGTVLGAFLALFGIVLAFSFSIAESRFSTRKEIALKDANAIWMTFLRADFLPEPGRVRARELLGAYAKLRLAATVAGNYGGPVRESETIQRELWKIGSDAASSAPQSLTRALFVESLGAMIDHHEERITIIMSFRLPPSLVWVLCIVAVLVMVTLGFHFGLGGSRTFVTYSLIVSIGALLLLIIDVDQVKPRFFRVGQSPLEDVVRQIEAAH